MNHDGWVGELDIGRKDGALLHPFCNLNDEITLLNKCHIEYSALQIRNDCHVHDFFQLWYVVRGGCDHYFNNNFYRQEEGSLMIIPPMLPHFLDASRECDFLLFGCSVPKEFFYGISNEMDTKRLFDLLYLDPLCVYPNSNNPILHFAGDTHREFVTLCDTLYRLYQQNREQSLTEFRVSILKMLSFILEHNTAGNGNDAISARYRVSIQQALDYIDTHYAEKLYLNQICQKAMLSTSTFSYLFKRITGKTFVEYLNYLRVQHACDMLIHTDIPLYSIAVFSGFSDNKNFCRIFKKIIGTAPSTYRKRHSAL